MQHGSNTHVVKKMDPMLHEIIDGVGKWDHTTYGKLCFTISIHHVKIYPCTQYSSYTQTPTASEVLGEGRGEYVTWRWQSHKAGFLHDSWIDCIEVRSCRGVIWREGESGTWQREGGTEYTPLRDLHRKVITLWSTQDHSCHPVTIKGLTMIGQGWFCFTVVFAGMIWLYIYP